jgi:hypothetical protein
MPKGYPKAKIDLDVDGIALPTAVEVARWKSSLIQVDLRIKGLQLEALIAAAGPQSPAQVEDSPRVPKARRIRSATKGKKGRRKKAKPVVEVAEAAPELPLKRRKQQGSSTWTSIIHNILEEAGRGLTHPELRTELEKTVMAERLAKSDKGFYGGIAKLADQKPPLLIKYKGRLFDPPVYRQFIDDVSAGKVPDLEDLPQIGNASPFRDAIMDLMKSRFADDGVSSADLIAALKENPALAGTVQRHPTHTYNVLARLLDRGELTKWNEKYFLGPRQRAA